MIPILLTHILPLRSFFTIVSQKEGQVKPSLAESTVGNLPLILWPLAKERRFSDREVNTNFNAGQIRFKVAKTLVFQPKYKTKF